jgi:hypothetical protein
MENDVFFAEVFDVESWLRNCQSVVSGKTGESKRWKKQRRNLTKDFLG